jgi:predicted MFS family arabinose efflux permease
MLGFGAIPLGAAIGGVIAGAIGLRETLAVFTALSAVATVQLGLSSLRRLRTAPDEEPVWAAVG